MKVIRKCKQIRSLLVSAVYLNREDLIASTGISEDYIDAVERYLSKTMMVLNKYVGTYSFVKCSFENRKVERSILTDCDKL